MEVMDIDKLAEDKFPPIKFKLDGTEYTVTTIPSEAMDGSIGEGSNPKVIRELLAVMVGKTEKDFRKTDFRSLVAANRYIMEQVKGQFTSLTSGEEPGESVD